ncbi:MAG TPA: HAMP domain-containing sensor histidine kinase [Actinomycetota bacterium]|nr:HAMP domain-containing sensor histidine kinase [Actinomycetota bacterium]
MPDEAPPAPDPSWRGFQAGPRRHRGPPWAGPGRGPGFRPPWWPENEPFPPAGRGGWAARRGRFARRAGLVLALFFGLTFASSALAVALLSGALGLGRHRGLAVVAGVLGLGLLFAAFVAAGRAVRRMAVPLSDVMEAAERVADGDYDVRVEERGSRDLRGLARSFNAMTERLRASEEQRRNLFADVAHELRTPLSVIQGNAEGLLDGLYPSDRAHLEPVLDETRIMARLLDDLQTLSTAEVGALRLHREPVDPRQLAEEAVTAFRQRADAAGIALELRAATGLPVLEADPMRIGEVLSNLLSNALRHTPPKGSVEVSVERVDGEPAVAFSVRDTGSGIAPDALPHVFDRFVKGPDSGGAGLGLAIARSLVEAHGGTITCDSSLGHGATMRFVLPEPVR